MRASDTPCQLSRMGQSFFLQPQLAKTPLSVDLILIKLNGMEFDVVWFDADNVTRLDFLEWWWRWCSLSKKSF